MCRRASSPAVIVEHTAKYELAGIKDKPTNSIPYFMHCNDVYEVFPFLPTGLRVSIAERRSFIETINRNIAKHEEDIRVKQSTLMHSKENSKRYECLVKKKKDQNLDKLRVCIISILI